MDLMRYINAMREFQEREGYLPLGNLASTGTQKATRRRSSRPAKGSYPESAVDCGSK